MRIDIELGSNGLTIDDMGRWYGADVLSTFGESLDELWDNAVVYYCDQDGGEGPEFSIGEFDLKTYCDFRDAIKAEYQKELARSKK